jgi:Bacterial regulatory proteins, tetR family
MTPTFGFSAGTAMASAAKADHGNRHGRSEEARLAILQAADDLLVDKGFDGVTMEGIAKRCRGREAVGLPLVALQGRRAVGRVPAGRGR